MAAFRLGVPVAGLCYCARLSLTGLAGTTKWNGALMFAATQCDFFPPPIFPGQNVP